jgi:hypothetical protein
MIALNSGPAPQAALQLTRLTTKTGHDRCCNLFTQANNARERQATAANDGCWTAYFYKKSGFSEVGVKVNS